MIMEVKAELNYLRIAPRKARLIVDAVRGKRVKDAQATLRFTLKKASEPVLKLINSAVANATQQYQLEAEDLYIKKITVDEGPTLKRWRARSRGQAFPIHKKSSHVTVVLASVPGAEKKAEERKAAAAQPAHPAASGTTDEAGRPTAKEKPTPAEEKQKAAPIAETAAKEKPAHPAASGTTDEAGRPKQKPVQRPERQEKRPSRFQGLKRLFRRKSF